MLNLTSTCGTFTENVKTMEEGLRLAESLSKENNRPISFIVNNFLDGRMVMSNNPPMTIIKTVFENGRFTTFTTFGTVQL